MLALSFLSLPILSAPTAHAASCPLSNANNTIEGCVVNSDTGGPVSGLNVYIIVCGGFQFSYYFVTDTNGYFSFQPTLVNGTPCINPNQAYVVSVNGVTTVTASNCNVPSCNVLGKAADNPAWGQWAGDVQTDNNGHGTPGNGQIGLTPARQVNVAAAILYSDTSLASMAYQMQTSYSVSHTIGVQVNTASVGYQSSFDMTYSQAFSVPGGNSEYVERPYYAVGYYCAGSTSESAYGWTCSQGLQNTGVTAPIPNLDWGTLPTSEYTSPGSVPSGNTCDTYQAAGSHTYTYTQSSSTSVTLAINSPITVFGISVTLSYSVSVTAGKSDTIGVTLNNAGPQTLDFKLYFAGGSCSNPTSELHVWDMSPNPDFSISASPASLIENPGSSGTSTITLSGAWSFSDTVSLTYSTPSGISVSLTPPSLYVSGTPVSSTAGLSVASYVQAGNYIVTITGTGSSTGIKHSVNIQIAVEDFTMSANPASTVILQSGTATSTITLWSLNGFSGTVSLGLAISPSAGLSCSLSQTSVTLGTSASSTLSCTGSVGTYSVTITGTSQSVSHSTPFGVVVTNYLMSMNPTELYWTCSRAGCNPGQQTATIQITAQFAYQSDTTFTLGYGCGSGSPNCNPTWTVQPGTITIPAGQKTGTATLTVAPGSGQNCTPSGGKTDCYTYIIISAWQNGQQVAQTTLTLDACHGVCPV